MNRSARGATSGAMRCARSGPFVLRVDLAALTLPVQAGWRHAHARRLRHGARSQSAAHPHSTPSPRRCARSPQRSRRRAALAAARSRRQWHPWPPPAPAGHQWARANRVTPRSQERGAGTLAVCHSCATGGTGAAAARLRFSARAASAAASAATGSTNGCCTTSTRNSSRAGAAAVVLAAP